MFNIDVTKAEDGTFTAFESGPSPLRMVAGSGPTDVDAVAGLLSYYSDLVRSGSVKVSELTAKAG